MQRAMRTVGAIVLPGQHNVVLGRMPKSGKSGSALEKLRAPCIRKEDAGRALRSRGEVPRGLHFGMFLSCPTCHLDTGSSAVKRAAQPVRTGPVRALKQAQRRRERNPTAESLPNSAAWISRTLARWLEKRWHLVSQVGNLKARTYECLIQGHTPGIRCS